MDLIKQFVSSFFKPKPLVSPIASYSGDDLTNPALLRYVQINQMNEQAAHDANQGITPTDSPTSTPTPSPQQGFVNSILNPHLAHPAQAQDGSLDQLTNQIHQGMMNYGGPPVATVSGALAQAGQGMPDPLLPAVIALKESSGGKNTTYLNNYLNMGHWGYPTMEGAALGGGGHVGIKQQITDPKYNSGYRDYMKSGNLADFFKTYTPPGGADKNASIKDQIKQYNQLRSNFTK